MIIWSGKGILVPLILFIPLLALAKLLPTQYADSSFVLSFLLGGVACWVLGKRWNKQAEKIFLDVETGQRVKFSRRHTLFWIPMQYWGAIFLFLSALLLIQDSLVLGVCSMIAIALAVFYDFGIGDKYFSQKRRPTNPPEVSRRPRTSKKEAAPTSKPTSPRAPEPKERRNPDAMTKDELAEYYRKYMPK